MGLEMGASTPFQPIFPWKERGEGSRCVSGPVATTLMYYYTVRKNRSQMQRDGRSGLGCRGGNMGLFFSPAQWAPEKGQLAGHSLTTVVWPLLPAHRTKAHRREKLHQTAHSLKGALTAKLHHKKRRRRTVQTLDMAYKTEKQNESVWPLIFWQFEKVSRILINNSASNDLS